MKIAVASRAAAPFHGRGGLERAVSDVCTELAKRGHTLTLFTRPATSAETETQPFAVVTVPWRTTALVRAGGVPDRALHYAPFVADLAHTIAERGEAYDLAIGHGAAAAAFVAPLANGQVRTLLVNPHGMEEFHGSPLKQLLLRRQHALVRDAAAVADAVIATDASLVQDARENLRVPQERVAVVPNGINIAYLDSLVPPDAAPVSPPVIVSVGRIESYKGLYVLALALGAIRDRLPTGWRWVHIGDGAARDGLRTTIKRAGITAQTALPGILSDAELHRTLSAATIFVNPSRFEGSSLVVLEAMARRLPVVASAVGGIPDKVIPNETGWLVPPNEPDALARVILTAMTTPPETMHAMGARGRAIVEARFSLPAAVDDLLALVARLQSPAE